MLAVAYLVLVFILARYLGSTIVLDSSLYLGVAIAGAVLLLALFSRKYPLAFISLLLLLTAATYPSLSHQLHLQRVEEGKKYVTRIAPALDKYKKDHGSYPQSLSEVEDVPLAPPGMQYGTLGDGYYVIIYDPQDFDYDRYDSSDQAWRRDN